MSCAPRSALAVAAVWIALQSGAIVGAEPCPDGVDGFRLQLEAFVADLRQTSTLADSRGRPRAALLRRSAAHIETALAGASTADLSALCGQFAGHPGLLAAPRLLNAALSQAPPAQGPENSCLLLTRGQFVTLFLASQAAKGVAAGAQTACEATECVPFACDLFCPLAAGLAEAVIFYDAILEEGDYCGKDTHFNFIKGFVDATGPALAGLDQTLENDVAPQVDRPVSSVASQGGLNQVRAATDAGFLTLGDRADRLAANLDSHVTDRAAHHEASLRQRIESHLKLGEEGRISLFQMPASVGGLLEVVRETVARTILAHIAAGQNVGRALQLFDAGDLHFNGGRYKSAFGEYRKAYREAVRGRPDG